MVSRSTHVLFQVGAARVLAAAWLAQSVQVDGVTVGLILADVCHLEKRSVRAQTVQAIRWACKPFIGAFVSSGLKFGAVHRAREKN